MADESVSCSGPLFDGRAVQAIKEGVIKTRRDLAKRGQALAMAALASSIHRQRTGQAVHSVVTTDHSTMFSSSSGHRTYSLPVQVDSLDTIVVTTSLATYGPWLEGTGSRNAQTRFPGYHGFRRAAQELEGQVQELAEGSMDPYIARCNE